MNETGCLVPEFLLFYVKKVKEWLCFVNYWYILKLLLAIGEITMNIYHGTILEFANNIIENGIIVDYKEANRGTDFGVGFYTTNCYKLAEITAKTKSHFHKDDDINNTPVVLIMKYDTSNTNNYNSKIFNKCDDEWKKFICANRYDKVCERDLSLLSNRELNYDVVRGAVADSSMFNIKKMIKENNYMLNNKILDEMKPLKIDNFIPMQISFHNQAIVGCIKIKAYDIIK